VGEARDFPEELAQRLEAQRDGKEGAILVTGHPKSGKSYALGEAARRLGREILLLRAEAVQIAGGTGVQLALKDGRGAEVILDDTDSGLNFIRERMKEGVVVAVELPKSLYFPGATEERVKELRELLRLLVDGLRRMSADAPLAIEGNNYTFRFIEGREEGPSAEDPEGKLRWIEWIAKHLKFMIEHERVVLGPPEGSVEVAYGEAEAKALLEKLAKNIDEKRKELVLKRKELVLRSARVNHGLHKGYYFPGLLVKGIEHPEALDKKRIEELEHFEEQLEVDAVGVGLANAAYEGASSTIARYAGEVLGTASGIFTSLLTFGLGLGASAGVLFLFGLARKREDPVKQILEMREKWEKLPEERKEYLGYRYDAALALPPGTARRWLDDFFHQSDDRIRQMIEELRGDFEELRDAVRRLEDEIARTAGYRQLNSEEDAGRYFGMESRDSLQPVWTIVDEVSRERVTVDQLVEGLVNDAKSGTGRVYLVRGEAGVGKSALAFYASCELLSRSGRGEALRVLQQARSVNLGAHISGRGEALRVLAAEGDFRPGAPNEPGTVVFLDDGKLADYKKEISDVLRGVVESFMAHGGEGGSGLHYPLVITVSDERWDRVEAALLRGENPAITSEDHREKWEELYREGKVIRRLSVSPLEEEEARKVLRSIMEKGDPPMKYDEQDKDVIEVLLNKAGGYPFILKEFIKELQGKRRERIDMSDVQAISGEPRKYVVEPRKYVVKRLKEAYFRPLGLLNTGPDLLDSVPFDKRAEACELLSFLYQLRIGLPAGLLLPGLADATPPGTLVDGACGVLKGLYRDCRPTFGMRLPLCSSYAGELRLSHPLTSDILEDAKRIAEGGEEVGGDDPLSFLRDMGCEGGQFESVGVKDLVEDAINYYRRGMRSTGLGPGDYFYGLFSLLLYSTDKGLIDEVLPSWNVLKDAGSIGEVRKEVRREVLDQLYELLNIANRDERLKTYYLLLLDNDHEHLAETWSSVPRLIDAGVISWEDAAAHKEGFLEMLESDDDSTKVSAWDIIPRLIDAGVISWEDAAAHKEGFLEMLESDDEGVKRLAWDIIPRLIDAGVISWEDAAAHKEGFLEMLESNDEGVKVHAWRYVRSLIRDGLISREEAAAHKEGLLELLESNDDWMKVSVWEEGVPRLIEAGVISKEDAAAHKEGLLELLESADVWMKLDAWDVIPGLIEAGLISREEAAAHKEGFLEMLKSADDWTKVLAWDIVPRLIEAGVISWEDLPPRPEL